MELTIIGSNSAVPAFNRFPSSQLLNIREHYFLIDCGEACQMRMETYRIKKSKISRIFISHLHGDHYFGLIGLLNSYYLLNRSKPLTIYGPPLLKEIIDIQTSSAERSDFFELNFVSTQAEESELIFEDEEVEVYSFPLMHSIPTTGFLFREKKALRKMDKEMIERYQIPFHSIPSIKRGADFKTDDGRSIPNKKLTFDPPEPLSYAYCSDTAYSETVAESVRSVDLLYHEATFLSGNATRAELTRHSTAQQAAEVAKLAGAGQLLIGHYSARYGDLAPFLEEAKAIFPNTHLAIEGKTFTL